MVICMPKKQCCKVMIFGKVVACAGEWRMRHLKDKMDWTGSEIDCNRKKVRKWVLG